MSELPKMQEQLNIQQYLLPVQQSQIYAQNPQYQLQQNYYPVFQQNLNNQMQQCQFQQHCAQNVPNFSYGTQQQYIPAPGINFQHQYMMNDQIQNFQNYNQFQYYQPFYQQQFPSQNQQQQQNQILFQLKPDQDQQLINQQQQQNQTQQQQPINSQQQQEKMENYNKDTNAQQQKSQNFQNFDQIKKSSEPNQINLKVKKEDQDNHSKFNPKMPTNIRKFIQTSSSTCSSSQAQNEFQIKAEQQQEEIKNMDEQNLKIGNNNFNKNNNFLENSNINNEQSDQSTTQHNQNDCNNKKDDDINYQQKIKKTKNLNNNDNNDDIFFKQYNQVQIKDLRTNNFFYYDSEVKIPKINDQDDNNDNNNSSIQNEKEILKIIVPSQNNNNIEWVQEYEQKNFLIKNLLKEDKNWTGKKQIFQLKNAQDQIQIKYSFPTKEQFYIKADKLHQKKRSKFHNKNKVFFISVLKIFKKQYIRKINMPKELYNNVLGLVLACRMSGCKMQENKVQKTDLFNHSHYNLLFQTINSESIKILEKSPLDQEIHLKTFGIDLKQRKIVNYKKCYEIIHNKLDKIHSQDVNDSFDNNYKQNLKNISLKSEIEYSNDMLYLEEKYQNNNNEDQEIDFWKFVEKCNFVKICLFQILNLYVKEQMLGTKEQQAEEREYDYRAFQGIFDMIKGINKDRF